jgi:hypothetical protein
MECEPAARLDVLKAATPLLNVPVPREVDPSINVTVPVAADGVTTAVRVTVALTGAGFADDETVIEEACSTFCVRVDDVLVLSLVSPP